MLPGTTPVTCLSERVSLGQTCNKSSLVPAGFQHLKWNEPKCKQLMLSNATWPEMRLTPTLQKSLFSQWHAHSMTCEQPPPLMLGWCICGMRVSQHSNVLISCVFSQLTQGFRATVSRFDYSQCYRDRDGCFQIKIQGLLVCSPQSVVFQKWTNSTVNASQPQIKISDFWNFCLAQSNKICSPCSIALPQRTQATRSC